MISLTEKEKKAITELVQGLKKLYGENLSRVILYGSKARGETTNGSDIDIAIIGKRFEDSSMEIKRTINIVANVSLKYDLLIAVVPLSEKEFEKCDIPFIINVKREGIKLL